MDGPALKDTSPKRLAFLFLTIDNLNQYHLWERFFAEADPQSYSIYVHPKHSDRVTQPLLLRNLIARRISTSWGHISVVRALNLMLEDAFRNQENTKFLYCSESCIPLYDFSYIYNLILSDEKGFLHHYPAKQRRHRHLKDRTYIPKHRFLKMCAQGWVFNRELVQVILRNDHTDIFENMSVPEENYYINLFQHVDLDLNRLLHWQRLSFSNWWEGSAGGGHPKLYEEITEAEVNVLRELGFLFMRKVSAGASVPIDHILKHFNLGAESR
jgi:Core-2/I-Branching enzyme